MEAAQQRWNLVEQVVEAAARGAKAVAKEAERVEGNLTSLKSCRARSPSTSAQAEALFPHLLHRHMRGKSGHRLLEHRKGAQWRDTNQSLRLDSHLRW